MNLVNSNSLSVGSIDANNRFLADNLELSKVINVTFMSMMESLDFSCVYRVRPGEDARSISNLVLSPRLRRQPHSVEIEAYLAELADCNSLDIKTLKTDDLVMLPPDRSLSLGLNQDTVESAFEPEKVISPPAKTVTAPPALSPSDVQYLIAPAGLGVPAGIKIDTPQNLIASRSASQDLSEDPSAKTYFYGGELAKSFLGLFRTFFVASETIDASSGNLLASRVEYDGFGASMSFYCEASTLDIQLVRMVQSKFEVSAGLYETLILCADGTELRFATSGDGKSSWKLD